ncbi:MAG: acyltransferase [Rhodoferax sp.]
MRMDRLDALRLGAALAVLWGHGWVLYGRGVLVPFAGHSLGSLAVGVFFAISGWLIRGSWQRQPDVGAFWRKRLARIYPGLLVASSLTVVLLGPAMTRLGAAQYWGSPEPRMYWLNNALALATVQTLPGVFEHNPFARAVNGSLWTLRYELLMYASVALLGRIPALRQRPPYRLLALGLGLAWLATLTWAPERSASQGGAWALFDWYDGASFAVLFYAGASLHDQRPPRALTLGLMTLASAALALWAAQPALVQLGVWGLTLSLLLAVIRSASAQRVSSDRRVDWSYGVYIYAFPVQQALAQWLWPHQAPFALYQLLSTLLTLLLAAASWRWVEAPSLRWAHRMPNPSVWR